MKRPTPIWLSVFALLVCKRLSPYNVPRIGDIVEGSLGLMNAGLPDKLQNITKISKRFTRRPIGVANRAVEIRKQNKIKLRDAIVWASAQVNSLLLVSRNTKDFPADEPGVRVPYHL